MGPQNEQEYFRLADGRELKSLHDLFEALKTMDDNLFFHHVRGKDNDFAFWIRDVFKQRYLARAVQLAKNKDDMSKILFIHQFV